MSSNCPDEILSWSLGFDIPFHRYVYIYIYIFYIYIERYIPPHTNILTALQQVGLGHLTLTKQLLKLWTQNYQIRKTSNNSSIWWKHRWESGNIINAVLCSNSWLQSVRITYRLRQQRALERIFTSHDPVWSGRCHTGVVIDLDVTYFTGSH